MDHFLSWDWAIFIFYPSPLSKPLIFCISQPQTAPNPTQSGLTPPCSASWEQTWQSHCIHPVVWPKSAMLSKGYYSWAGWNKEQEKGKVSPRVSSRDRRVRWLQADTTCQWQNTPTPECFTAISGRTWFGVELLPVCNFSKQKHRSAYAEAEKGIKLKYYCCFADNLSQQYKLEVRGCPGLPSQSMCQVRLAQIWFSNSCQRFSCQVQRHLFKPVKIPWTGWSQSLGLLPKWMKPPPFGASKCCLPLVCWEQETTHSPLAAAVPLAQPAWLSSSLQEKAWGQPWQHCLVPQDSKATK